LNVTRVSSTFAAGRMACAAPSWWTMGCTAILQQQFVSTCKLAVQEVITQLNFKIHLTTCALFFDTGLAFREILRLFSFMSLQKILKTDLSSGPYSLETKCVTQYCRYVILTMDIAWGQNVCGW
jgi:hypothetical protein